MAGLYLHIPFCTQRCLYCDFYFVTTQRQHTGFVQTLCAEIAHQAATFGTREPVETIYFGGGTPSLLAVEDLATILQTCHQQFDTAALREVTLELNPEDADLDRLRDLRQLGIDRLSIGIQSFYEADLTFMNRSHTAEQAAEIVPMARRAGFENFSVDLIFGLPEQPPEYWMANTQKAADLEVPHLSCYGLTVEEKTPLAKQIARGLITPADEETMAERFQFTMDYLRQRGYEHYEISSFAKPGKQAQHNQAYWTHANYLGFGPSAHSFWWQGLPATRWANVRNLKQYEALIRGRHAPVDFREQLDLDSLANEYILLRLRTQEGLDLNRLNTRYGVDLVHEKPDALAWLEDAKYLTLRNHHVRLTDLGKTVADTVTTELMLDV